MVALHPEYLTKDGKIEFAVLPYKEFVAVKVAMEDMEDLLDLRRAQEADVGQPLIALEEVKKNLGINF